MIYDPAEHCSPHATPTPSIHVYPGLISHAWCTKIKGSAAFTYFTNYWWLLIRSSRYPPNLMGRSEVLTVSPFALRQCGSIQTFVSLFPTVFGNHRAKFIWVTSPCWAIQSKPSNISNTWRRVPTKLEATLMRVHILVIALAGLEDVDTDTNNPRRYFQHHPKPRLCLLAHTRSSLFN